MPKPISASELNRLKEEAWKAVAEANKKLIAFYKAVHRADYVTPHEDSAEDAGHLQGQILEYSHHWEDLCDHDTYEVLNEGGRIRRCRHCRFYHNMDDSITA